MERILLEKQALKTTIFKFLKAVSFRRLEGLV